MNVEASAFLVGTLWFPSLNPLGAPSIFAAGISVLGVILTENWRRFDFKILKAVLVVIVPLSLFGFVVASKVAIGAFEKLSLSFPWQGHRNFPDADDFCSNYVYLAFALMISLRAWRLTSVPFRIFGMLETLSIASLVVTEFVLLCRLV